MSIFTLVFAILLVLKLVGVGAVATLSWWWIFLPLIIGFAWWGLVVLIAILVD